MSLIDALSRLASRATSREVTSPTSLLDGLGIEQVPLPEDPEERLRALAVGPTGAAPGADRVGRFELGAELGRGGMGRVVAARDPELRRSVAVKLLLNPERMTEARLARFVAEAQITSQLQHPNIVPIYDLGAHEDGTFFIVMQRVEGRSLGQVLEDEAEAEWTTPRLLAAFAQVCNAVGYAHERGVLHRDIKPDNLMLGRFGEVYVMDWGVARTMGDETEVLEEETVERVTLVATRDGASIGTPGYMSPEQCEGVIHALDGRADVFSLGAVLYEILTRRAAFPGNNMFARVARTLSGPPDPRAVVEVADEIAQVCMQALALDPADRPPTAQELGRRVQDYVDGSQRRREADGHARDASAALEGFREVGSARALLAGELRELSARCDPWATLDSPEKEALLAARARARDLEQQQQRRFADVLHSAELALAGDPQHAAARRVLADAHADALLAAERRDDHGAIAHHATRLEDFDDGTHRALREGTGTLSFDVHPAGGAVTGRRFERGVVWSLGDEVDLGLAPVVDATVSAGSWVLRVEGSDARFPAWLPRAGAWTGARIALPEPPPDGFVFVPPGSALLRDPSTEEDRSVHVGGFAVSIFPVTMTEYAAFLSALAINNPDEAWDRSPRQESGASGSGGQYWERPEYGEPYVVPVVDRDGDPWHPQLPAHSVSHDDARAYLAWWSEQHRLNARLLREDEWEKAARGVDGRRFPWGDTFDAALCKMRVSRAGRAQPEPVGAFEHDVSVYGVRDLAGSMREWVAGVGSAEDRRRIRGGSWYATEQGCEATHRIEAARWTVNSNLGFRVAMSWG